MAGLLDTQNKRWASDKSAFGYRMLTKMGWKDGKGLGSKEDGTTTHIRPKKRVTSGGIGITNPNATAWDVPAAVAAGLDNVLAALAPVSAGTSADERPERNRVVRTRGFYGRRAAGKDVRNYSQTALAEIFGGADCRDGRSRPAGEGGTPTCMGEEADKEEAEEADVEGEAERRARRLRRRQRRKERKESKERKALRVKDRIGKDRKKHRKSKKDVR